SSRSLVFQANAPAVPGDYTNSAVAFIGTTQIDTTLETTDNAPATATFIVKAHPTITTTTGGTVALNRNTPLTDSATLAGGRKATGTLTSQLFAPGGATSLYTNVVTVHGDATYESNDPTGTMNRSAVPTTPGTYQWVVTYSGDLHNSPVSSNKGAEPENAVDATISIAPQSPVNEINHQETFAITVTAFPAGTGTPPF